MSVPVESGFQLDRFLKRLIRYPWRSALQFIRLILHFGSYLRLKKTLGETGLLDLARAFPEYQYKFLGFYLSPSFSVSQRASILIHSYRFMVFQKALPFRQVLAGNRIEIWSKTSEAGLLNVCLAPAYDSFMEGDLSLLFQCGGNPLHRVLFSFMPGRLCGLPDPTVIFIGGSQGYRSTSGQVRLASKVLGEICPANFLVLLVKALAKTLGLRSIIGVSVGEHSCRKVKQGQVRPLSNYDALWEANGAERCGPFFRMPSDLSFRPSMAGTSSHRARARRKQEKKWQLYSEVLATYGVDAGQCPIPGLSPSAKGGQSRVLVSA
jgi:uncharacterized protein VirK/YbjX